MVAAEAIFDSSELGSLAADGVLELPEIGDNVAVDDW